MIQNDAGVYQFSSFLRFENVIHGFSTRAFGDLKREGIKENIQQFSSALAISQEAIVCMDQIHGNTVAHISKADRGLFIAETDGMVADDPATFLCVRTADCVPMLAYDPVAKIGGVAHAGWKGSLSNIAEKLIEGMKNAGADEATIRIGIGPSIRVCCYSIDNNRASLFASAFPKIADTILEQRDGVMYLNLQQLVMQQLIKVGILQFHIEDSAICTHDKSYEFFSYRDKKVQPGLFAGIIGLV